MRRFARIPLLAIGCLLVLVGAFSLAPVMTHAQQAAPRSASEHQDKQVVAYYTQWSIYGANFFIHNLVTSGTAGKLTTLIYAFGNISPDLQCFEINQAGQGDAWADYQRPFPADQSVNGVADSWGQTLAGNFNQLKELKALYPHLKILISLGGWTWSAHFSDAALPQNREAFVRSCINQYILGNLPQLDGDPSGGSGAAAGIFDGFDIDWEYPAVPGNVGNVVRPQDTQNFTGLLATFRHQLDVLGSRTNKHYLLTAATSSGQDKYQRLQLGEIGRYLDWANVLTYDMHGAWDVNGPSDVLAPLYADPQDPSTPPSNTYSIDHAVRDYIAAGFPANKIVLGMAIYGRGWTNVPDNNHGLYQSSPAMQPAPGSLGAGVEDFNVLETLSGYTGYRDPLTQGYWIFNGTTFWSFDDPTAIAAKMAYVWKLGLGGAYAWSLDGDDSSGTFMTAIYNGLASAPPRK